MSKPTYNFVILAVFGFACVCGCVGDLQKSMHKIEAEEMNSDWQEIHQSNETNEKMVVVGPFVDGQPFG